MRVLRPGDLVRYQEKVRRVLRLDKMVRTAITEDIDGDTVEIENPCEGAEFLGNPAETWKVLNPPTKVGAGPFVSLRVPGARPRTLVPWVDWIQSDSMREGGPVFIRPTLRILPFTSLLFTHRNGASVGYTVPSTFSTTRQKKKRIEKARRKAAQKPDRFGIMDDEDWQ